MAFSRIEPQTVAAEDVLRSLGIETQILVTACVIHVWGVPETDAITVVDQCRVAVPDVSAVMRGIFPDVIIHIFTSDAEKLEKSTELKVFLKQEWRKMFPHIKAEIWIQRIEDWDLTYDIPE